MKRTTIFISLSFLLVAVSYAQSGNDVDDIYYNPNKDKTTQSQTQSLSSPKYKNGAKEIIYVDKNQKNSNAQKQNYDVQSNYDPDQYNNQYSNQNQNNNQNQNGNINQQYAGQNQQVDESNL